jgi:hypothetical protein
MAFKGYFKALTLTPAPCGLFSVADVTTHGTSSEDERWIRGFDYEINGIPGVALKSIEDNVVTGGQLSVGSATNDWLRYQSFFIEVTDKHSGFGADVSLFDQALNTLEVVTQKAVEVEFWDGLVALADASDNVFLAKTGAPVVTTGGKAPEVALQAIEQSIASSPFGSAGVIHMTRDVASSLGSRLLWKDGKVQTRLGTEVVVGSGYSGSGPAGATGAAPSATNKWMYATGPISVHLGAKEVRNSSLAEGFDPSTNTLEILADRPAAVYFDSSIYAAAQVTLTAV